MIRPIAVLVAAILMTRPSMPKPEVRRYATVLNEVAASRGYDPLIAVAIIHFETQWQPSLVSADGEDFGLGQIRARYLGACREDDDPLNAPSEACQSAKQGLLDGVTNLRRMGTIIEANMAFCKARTGSSMPERWLPGYQGYGDPDRGRFCEAGEKTFKVLKYYDDLVKKLAPPKKTPKANPRQTSTSARVVPPSDGKAAHNAKAKK